MIPSARLRSRTDFERVRTSGRRVSAPEFVLYHSLREAGRQAPGSARIGLAVGRRLGGAVVRNRVKRMLREAIRPLLPRLAACDIVIVARPPVLETGVADLEAALADAAARAGVLDGEPEGTSI